MGPPNKLFHVMLTVSNKDDDRLNIRNLVGEDIYKKFNGTGYIPSRGINEYYFCSLTPTQLAFVVAMLDDRYPSMKIEVGLQK